MVVSPRSRSGGREIVEPLNFGDEGGLLRRERRLMRWFYYRLSELFGEYCEGIWIIDVHVFINE